MKKCLGLLMVLAVSVSVADVRVGALFSDGMVIQQNTLAPMWGWAEPGEKISVSCSWGATAHAKADGDGSWNVMLKTPEAGAGHHIKVVGDNTIEIKDVASGEVWFCSGQSNMEFRLGMLVKDAREPQYQPLVEYIRNEIATAADPLLRHITVPKTPSPEERLFDFEGKWGKTSPEENASISATAYFFARELRKELNVPVGLSACSWGGTRVQPWISKDTYMADPEKAAHYRREMEELKKRAAAWSPEKADKKYKAALAEWEADGKQGRRPRKQGNPVNDKQRPATLHNGMVSAVLPYAIKGVIWYQGESNAGYMNEYYEDYFCTLISSWRREWNRGDFPFYWVQLSAFKEPNAEPVENEGWANVNDQQRRALKLPNTGMAVSIDVGEARDIHPHNKMDVGKRLALWALANDYGVEVPAFSGPLYKSHKIEGGKVLITFSHTGSGLMAGNKVLLEDAVEVDEPLRRFQICGADRVWKWADAGIAGKDTVEVSHPDIPEPAVVRYAWSVNPEGANLYNKEGLPAAVFTTE